MSRCFFTPKNDMQTVFTYQRHLKKKKALNDILT